MERYVFFNIGWMEQYSGEKEDYIINGGSYVKEHGQGAEDENFLPVGEYCYGYVRLPKGRKINLTRIDPEVDTKDGFIDEVMVFWVATRPQGGRVVVGWYRHARVYAQIQENLNGQSVYCHAVAKAADCALVPAHKRIFSIPSAAKGEYGGFGQSNVWYAEEVKLTLIPQIIRYANKEDNLNPKTILLTWNADNNPDDLDILDAKEAIERDGGYSLTWSCNYRRHSLGDRVFLVKQGNHSRGIIASGMLSGNGGNYPHWNDELAQRGRTSHFVDIILDNALNPDDDDIISIEELNENFPAQKWSPFSSGITVKEEYIAPLEKIWSERVEQNKIRKRCGVIGNWAVYDQSNASWEVDREAWLNKKEVELPQSFEGFFCVRNLLQNKKLSIELHFKGEVYNSYIIRNERKICILHIPYALANTTRRQIPQKSDKVYLSIRRKGCYYNFKILDLNDDSLLMKGDSIESRYQEGKQTLYYTAKYERDSRARRDAILIHGTRCQICGFDFGEVYGELGQNFIEVHHLKPLASMDEEAEINPQTDLICVCANCHRMFHHKRNGVLSKDELAEIVSRFQSQLVIDEFSEFVDFNDIDDFDDDLLLDDDTKISKKGKDAS